MDTPSGFDNDEEDDEDKNDREDAVIGVDPFQSGGFGAERGLMTMTRAVVFCLACFGGFCGGLVAEVEGWREG